MRITHPLILLLSFRKSIITSAQLVERQPQGVWPDLNWGNLFWDGVTVFRGIENLFQDPPGSDSKTKPPPDTDAQPDGKPSPDSPEVAPAEPPSSATSSPAEPVYKLKINNDPSPPPDLGTDLPLVQPSVNEGCDFINMNDADCGKTTDQLIFTTSCAGINPNQVISVEARAQNQAIREILVVMNGQNILAGTGGRGLRISTSDICDVYFFAVPLTRNQIQEIEKNPGVEFVSPNQALSTEDISESSDPADSDPAEIPVLTAPGSQLNERDRVIVDLSASDDLLFISTPPGSSRLSRSYDYFSNAGDGVTVIGVDSGVNTLHDEFVTLTGESSLLEERIAAMDTSDLADDYDNLGTCRTSKIVGRTLGVARRAKVMVTKVARSLSSLSDVFVQISNFLYRKHLRQANLQGYHVMSIMIQWDNTDPPMTSRFEEMFDLLIREFQLVVVVPAGNDATNHNSDINRWPAVAERRHEIIVVGAVRAKTGATASFSRGGPFLSVNAPGIVTCARNQAGTDDMLRRGTDVATTLVAGLIAYLLSLEDVGPTLRDTLVRIPRRVKDYVMTTASYKRLPDEFRPAIWNSLGAPT